MRADLSRITRFAILAIVAAFALALSACGSDDDDSGSADAGSSAATSTEAAPEAGSKPKEGGNTFRLFSTASIPAAASRVTTSQTPCERAA